MKRIITSILLIALAACSTTQQGQILTTAAAIANTTMSAYTAYAAAQTGTLTPQQVSAVATSASNDLNGIASLAQAYVGSNKTTADLKTGAKNVAVASKLVALLPNTPITQSNVNTLYQAAAIVAAQSPGTTQARWRRELNSGQITASDYHSLIRGKSDLERIHRLPVRNAAFMALSRADQRDATLVFRDERLTFESNPNAVMIRP